MGRFGWSGEQSETESKVRTGKSMHLIGLRTRRPAGGRRRWRRGALCLAIAAASLLGLLGVPAIRTLRLQPGRNIELTAGGVTGTVTSYYPGELWGGGSEEEACSVCSPSGLLAHSGGQSTQPGQDVDPMMGDYTNHQDL